MLFVAVGKPMDCREPIARCAKPTIQRVCSKNHSQRKVRSRLASSSSRDGGDQEGTSCWRAKSSWQQMTSCETCENKTESEKNQSCSLMPCIIRSSKQKMHKLVGCTNTDETLKNAQDGNWQRELALIEKRNAKNCGG